MIRLLTLASAVALAACAPEAPPPAATARPAAAAAATAPRPATTAPAFNPLDTGVAATPGSGGGGY